jgi:sugar O-acyltransferase (sialic acid O-acetyltransferase NeuD family)
MSGKKLAIIGTGGLGRETLWAFQSNEQKPGCDHEVIGFLTSAGAEHGTDVCGLPVLGDESWVIGKPGVEVVCCIGDPRARRRVTQSLVERGASFATVIHPSVAMSDWVQVGVGCIIGARSVLTTQVTVGDHVVIGVGAIVSHDASIEDFATLAPGVLLAGHTRVGYCAELGAGATVIPEKSVGRGALVGAQAVVVEDVEPSSIVAGVPARVINSFSGDLRL